MRLKTTEASVLAGCLLLLNMRHILAWRNNSGALKDRTGRLVRYGKVGSSDILGILDGGRFLAIECKAPGKKPTESQLAFLAAVEREGGLAVCVDSVAALAAILDEELT